jgi:glutamyl-tRNA reductase
MKLLVAGCNFRTAGVELREKLAFAEARVPEALGQLSAGYGCEAVILSTCNRVELYLGRTDPTEVFPDVDLLAEFLANFHGVPAGVVRPSLYAHREGDAVRHLFRVTASLDSLIVGEGQIAGQTKHAYEQACVQGTAGPLLHALFQHARQVARRVRTETGIARGHVSVSSAAVDYVRQVFDHFHDKKVLVIGAGKMGELTLKHLRQLRPQRILVTNRSSEKAEHLARACQGVAVAWERLDEALAKADIVLSTTGAPDPVVTLDRFNKVLARRSGGTMVILDIAVPRDFDPRIHDGDRACLFNIDDLKRVREQTLHERMKHLGPAEALVEQEQKRFLKEWTRRQHGPVIARLTREFESKRQKVFGELMQKLNGKLTEADRCQIDGALRLLQNQFLHGPISALTAESHEEGRHTLLEALRKLFSLEE